MPVQTPPTINFDNQLCEKGQAIAAEEQRGKVKLTQPHIHTHTHE